MARKRSPGDLYAIQLPNGRYAFGRLFEDAHIGILTETGSSPNDVPTDLNYAFIVGIYDRSLRDWKRVGFLPFQSDDEAWPPPMKIEDPISGKFRIYQHGEMRPATAEECRGLEVAAVWDTDQIVDRIMGIDKWHRDD